MRRNKNRYGPILYILTLFKYHHSDQFLIKEISNLRFKDKFKNEFYNKS